jgi:hypothetical protein
MGITHPLLSDLPEQKMCLPNVYLHYFTCNYVSFKYVFPFPDCFIVSSSLRLLYCNTLLGLGFSVNLLRAEADPDGHAV